MCKTRLVALIFPCFLASFHPSCSGRFNMAKRNALGEIKKGKKEFITIRKLLNDLAGRIVPGPNFLSTQFYAQKSGWLFFFPKMPSNQGAFTKKKCSHAFLTLPFQHLANLGARCSWLLPWSTCSPKWSYQGCGAR